MPRASPSLAARGTARRRPPVAARSAKGTASAASAMPSSSSPYTRTGRRTRRDEARGERGAGREPAHVRSQHRRDGELGGAEHEARTPASRRSGRSARRSPTGRSRAGRARSGAADLTAHGGRGLGRTGAWPRRSPPCPPRIAVRLRAGGSARAPRRSARRWRATRARHPDRAAARRCRSTRRCVLATLGILHAPRSDQACSGSARREAARVHEERRVEPRLERRLEQPGESRASGSRRVQAT